MKKNSKSKPFDYSIFGEFDFDYNKKEFFGLFVKRGKLKIDTKRFQKYIPLQKEVKERIEKRSTKYFFPEKKSKYDYVINIFRDTILTLKTDWNKEFKPLKEKLRTADEVRQDTISNNLSTGVLEYDEALGKAEIARAKRTNSLDMLFLMINAQYIHQSAATLEATMIRVLEKKCISIINFSRDKLGEEILKKTKVDIKELKNHIFYDKFYCLWNFLKHNSISAYDKVKNRHSDLLLDENENYANGNLAIYYVKLSNDVIIDLLNNLLLFFEEFCFKVFGESIEESKWNYDNYFIKKANEKIIDLS